MDGSEDDGRSARVASHVARVLERFETPLRSDTRFPDAGRLLKRFRAVAREIAGGARPARALHEVHNELCVATSLLAQDISALAYEPVCAGASRTIDFRATTKSAQTVFVDVKTIHPKDSDRWDQFERGQREGWIPTWMELSRDWLGGEMWHSMFAARSRMLEYAIELESKISAAQLGSDGVFTIMMFCGNGFDWRPSELEDFVAFYFSGHHRFDDPFAAMERHAMAQRNLALNRTITRFGYLERSGVGIEPAVCSWDVQPPDDLTA